MRQAAVVAGDCFRMTLPLLVMEDLGEPGEASDLATRTPKPSSIVTFGRNQALEESDGVFGGHRIKPWCSLGKPKEATGHESV
jgi:hypothetical protein